MKHIQLKFVKTVKRYTTSMVENRNYIQSINRYPIDHPDYKKENGQMYITYDRLMELQTEAMKAGYLFTY